MKLKNVKEGQLVKVKRKAGRFLPKYSGMYGTVEHVEDLSYIGNLTVYVRFSDASSDWGNHEDIKPIKL